MLSAVILTKNEEKNLAGVLESVSFADEIIVVDNGSIDHTSEIAEKFGAKILSLPKIDDFAYLRNSGLKKAKSDWVFFLDADERVSPELKLEIIDAVSSTKYSAFRIKRQDFFMGKKICHGEVKKASHIGFTRLMKKNSGKWKGMVHEEFQSESELDYLKHPIIHTPHETIADFIIKVNKYSSIRAKELKTDKKNINGLEIIFYPLGKFFYTYFILAGFLDGAEGFIYSFMMSFHSFLTRAKLYTS